jgi:hypothetical protein
LKDKPHGETLEIDIFDETAKIITYDGSGVYPKTLKTVDINYE